MLFGDFSFWLSYVVFACLFDLFMICFGLVIWFVLSVWCLVIVCLGLCLFMIGSFVVAFCVCLFV